jgi:3-dehydroquinate dehydratase-2
MARILVLNGPNLNLLGSREPGHYGHDTLASIEQRLKDKAGEHTLEFFQSNAEHELVERVHRAGADGVAFILINPAALTHTSVALRDALLGVAIPLSRSTSPTSLPARPSVTGPICPTSPSA